MKNITKQIKVKTLGLLPLCLLMGSCSDDAYYSGAKNYGIEKNAPSPQFANPAGGDNSVDLTEDPDSVKKDTDNEQKEKAYHFGLEGKILSKSLKLITKQEESQKIFPVDTFAVFLPHGSSLEKEINLYHGFSKELKEAISDPIEIEVFSYQEGENKILSNKTYADTLVAFFSKIVPLIKSHLKKVYSDSWVNKQIYNWTIKSKVETLTEGLQPEKHVPSGAILSTVSETNKKDCPVGLSCTDKLIGTMNDEKDVVYFCYYDAETKESVSVVNGVNVMADGNKLRKLEYQSPPTLAVKRTMQNDPNLNLANLSCPEFNVVNDGIDSVTTFQSKVYPQKNVSPFHSDAYGLNSNLGLVMEVQLVDESGALKPKKTAPFPDQLVGLITHSEFHFNDEKHSIFLGFMKRYSMPIEISRYPGKSTSPEEYQGILMDIHVEICKNYDNLNNLNACTI